MPIPSRPIPSSRTTRPGTSVPRKSPLSLDKTDWRSELSLISAHPKSLPAHNGVKLMEQAEFDKILQAGITAEGGVVLGKREVGVDGLIIDGKGRREKRVTTATTLGFDFIPNPSILALPDVIPDKRSLLSSTLRVKGISSEKLNKDAVEGFTSPALSGTPTTPALIPAVEDEEIEGLENDDWELVSRGEGLEEARHRQVEDDDGDLCILGELELEDAPIEGKKAVGKPRLREISYAAAAIGFRDE